MTKEQLLKQPLWQYTGEQLLEILDSRYHRLPTSSENEEPTQSSKWYVHGIPGLCELLKCSKATAHRIKNSGIIKDAIIQTGRKIIIDAELALERIRAQRSKGGRKCSNRNKSTNH